MPHSNKAAVNSTSYRAAGYEKHPAHYNLSIYQIRTPVELRGQKELTKLVTPSAARNSLFTDSLLFD